MGEPLDSITKIFLGALLATLFAIWRERRRDRENREYSTASENRRRTSAFVTVIDPVIAALSKNRPPKATYHDSLTDLKSVARAFSEILENDSKAAFLQTWQKYTEVNQRLLEPELKQLPGAGMGIDYSRGIQLLLPLLKELRGYAK